MLNSELLITLEPFKLRDDKYTFLFDSPNTNKDFLFSNPKAFKTLMKFLVFLGPNFKAVTENSAGIDSLTAELKFLVEPFKTYDENYFDKKIHHFGKVLKLNLIIQNKK